MDPADNPYTPNAGALPPILAGRDRELDDFRIHLRRLKRGHTEQSMILTGLRGVGKTVLLTAFEREALEQGFATADTEITLHDSFAGKIALLARRALLEISPSVAWRDRARRAAGVIRSFQIGISTDGTLQGGFAGVIPLEGLADTGNLGEDLTDVFVALGEAAREHETGVVFLFDEIQFLARGEFEALVAALHKTVQRGLPITLVAAGLPQLPELAGAAKSYAERLFRFPIIGRLGRDAAIEAITSPVRALGASYEFEAATAIADYTEGYPYFLQEYGYTVWNAAPVSPITLSDVKAAQLLVETKLDESFFRVRTDRMTPRELKYARAMAELGSEPQLARDVAALLDRTSTQVAAVRASLIRKGVLYATSHGYAQFTVPQFDRFLRRTLPLDGAVSEH